jgi:hypothetical protein
MHQHVNLTKYNSFKCIKIVLVKFVYLKMVVLLFLSALQPFQVHHKLWFLHVVLIGIKVQSQKQCSSTWHSIPIRTLLNLEIPLSIHSTDLTCNQKFSLVAFQFENSFLFFSFSLHVCFQFHNKFLFCKVLNISMKTRQKCIHITSAW